MKAKQRLFTDTKQHFFLFGPRGTGKSTWLRRHYTDAIWIDLLEPALFRKYEARPERLGDAIAHQAKHSQSDCVVVIDEIQKVPEMLSAVHAAIETNPNLQFVLTGSSARKLKRAGVDLLGGRAAVKKMHPFVATELKSDFNLLTALELGMLPVVYGAKDPHAALNGYIDVYLREEIQAEALVRRIAGFGRFMEAISFSQGSVLNLSDVARDCEVKRSTATGYVEILEDLLISRMLPVFSKRSKRNLVSKGKFFFFDCGVYRSIRPKGPLDRPEEIDGISLETLVFQHLSAMADYSNKKQQLFFWRTQTGMEVDFVYYGESTFWAIEVKNAATIRNRDLSSLRAFCKDYPEALPFLLYRGNEDCTISGIRCMPVESFLTSLQP
ncbi:MAG: ATP-binding protein [Deltaproteobacteria bacterium]|nr:ATP-binding protein [Deltaproteobacteria bacterium]MBN2673594.1 ATP-binding protein [Deltaproteobacteria bacterium]